jgi:translation initiation factor IF-1
MSHQAGGAALGRLLLALALAVGAPAALPAQTPAPAPAPGTLAPAATVSELQQTLAAATARFQAMDGAGVLAHVSDRYRNGPITKASVRDNLLAMFALYDTVRAQVRIDEVRMVDGAAWVYSTGEVTGRLRGIGAWTSVLSWEREPEVARREGAAWKLEGPGP